MEQETLFTSSKWDILKCLEAGKKSPIDLARDARTSVANISQQLRLLELAGFVRSERVSNRDKGLPRVLYSLSDNYSYLVLSSPGFVNKKFMKLQEFQKMVLRLWFVDNVSLHYYLEKYFWSVERFLDRVDFFGFDFSDTNNIKVIILSENSDVKKGMKEVNVDGKDGTKNFAVVFCKESDIRKNFSKYYVVHDPKNLCALK